MAFSDGTDGTDGTNGTDGNDGRSTFQAKIFRRVSDSVVTPTGGSFDFTNNTLTPPTDWSDSVPAGTDPLFSTTGLFSIIGQTGTDTTVTWATPQVEAMNGEDGDVGADGRSTYLASIFQRSSSTITATPTGGSYDFGDQELTPPSGGWGITIPTTNTDPLYISTALASAIGASGVDSTLTWTAPALMAMSGEDGADGSDGTNGSDGSDGTDATQTAEGSVYYTVSQSDNPGVPSASNYNFTDGSFTGLTANWQVDPVTVTIENTSDTFWMSRWRAVQAPGASTATTTFQTPIGSLVLGTNLQSDNFVEGSAGWRIQRDTGDAEFGAAVIRGELVADQIRISGSIISGNNGTLQVNPAFIRNNMRSGRNIGNVEVTGSTDSLNLQLTASTAENITADSITVSSSFNANPVTININSGSTPYDIIILGDIISTGSNSGDMTISTSGGNIMIFGDVNLESGRNLSLIAAQGCVQIFGETIDPTNSLSIINAGGNVCANTPN